jgi:MFS family permease
LGTGDEAHAAHPGDEARAGERRGGLPYRWAVVGMLWLICFFNYADRQAIFSVFPLLGRELRLDDVQLGIIGSAFMWTYAAFAPVAGLVADRLSRKTLILGGLLFWSAVTVATALADSYAALVLCRALEGLGEAFYFPASMSLISAYHGPSTRSRAMALHQSSVYAGTIAGGGVAGALGERLGWRSGFVLFGGLGVLLALVLWRALREPRRGSEAGVATSSVDSRSDPAPEPRWLTPRTITLMAVFAGANFVAMVFLTWTPSYLYRNFGMSLTMAGLSGTAYLQIASVVGVLCGGVLADRWRRRHPAGRLATQALGLLLGAPFIVWAGQTHTASAVVIAIALFGLGKGLYDANIWAALHDVVPVHRRATAVGVMNAVGWIGGGAAPLAIAAAARHLGLGGALSASAAIYVLAAVGLGLAAPRRKSAPGAPRRAA